MTKKRRASTGPESTAHVSKRSKGNMSDDDSTDYEQVMGRIRAISSKGSNKPAIKRKRESQSSTRASSAFRAANSEADSGLKSRKSRAPQKENRASDDKTVKGKAKEAAIRAGSIVILGCGIDHLDGFPFFTLKDAVAVVNTLKVWELAAQGMAVTDLKNGFSITENDTPEQIMEMLEDNFPRLWRFLKINDAVDNPFYQPGSDPRSRLSCAPVMLCIKNSRNMALVPGPNGLFPDGRVIKLNSASKRNGAWTENIIVFASFPTIPDTLIDAWTSGSDPDPYSFLSSSSPHPRIKGKGKGKAVLHFNTAGSSQEDANEKDEANPKSDDDTAEEDSQIDNNDDSSEAEDTDDEDKVTAKQRMTRSMTRSQAKSAPSHSARTNSRVSRHVDSISSSYSRLDLSSSINPGPSNVVDDQQIIVSSDDESSAVPVITESAQPHPSGPSFFTRRLADDFKNDSDLSNINIFTSTRRNFSFGA